MEKRVADGRRSSRFFLDYSTLKRYGSAAVGGRRLRWNRARTARRAMSQVPITVLPKAVVAESQSRNA